ncbi:MAG: DUF2147 domain-containing protein [Bacteroidota bacterium]
MKKNAWILFIMIFAGTASLYGQSGDVTGIWRTENRDSQVEIYRTSSGTYEGKLVWLKEPLDENGKIKRDVDNPDENLRSRPLKGLVLLKEFQYNVADKEWEGGKIYDPESGKTYEAYMWMDGNNKLHIKGYLMGMRWMGRSTSWTRDRAVLD